MSVTTPTRKDDTSKNQDSMLLPVEEEPEEEEKEETEEPTSTETMDTEKTQDDAQVGMSLA
jgi:tetrahydromethanopterin S-methyltransferase subunit A